MSSCQPGQFPSRPGAQLPSVVFPCWVLAYGYDQVPKFQRIRLPESSRKEQSTFQKNEPYAVMKWISSFLYLSSFTWKGIWEVHFRRSRMSENFLNLSLHLVDNKTIFYVQNNFASEFWKNHFSCCYLTSFWFSVFYMLLVLFSLEDAGIYDNVLWFGSLLF